MHLRVLLTLAALWGSAIGQWPCREVSGGGDPTLAGAIARPIPARPIPLGAPLAACNCVKTLSRIPSQLQ